MTGNIQSSPDIILLGERAQQLDMLLHVQEFSAMSVLITGPAEIGKTALLNTAANQLSVHHQVVMVDALQTQQLPEIIEHIALELGCGANLIDLDTHLVNMAAQQESVHLLIDDAHLLSVDVLQLLLGKSTLDHGWHLILSGDASLKNRLDDLQDEFDNKLYHLIELAPFTEEESETFVTQLYKRAGVDVVPISLKDIHQLWQLSGGVPGKLLELIELEQDAQQVARSGFPVGHIAAVVLIASALIVSLLYQSGSSQDAVTPEDAIAALVANKKRELSQEQRDTGLSSILDAPSDLQSKKQLLQNTSEGLSENELNDQPPIKQVTIRNMDLDDTSADPEPEVVEEMKEEPIVEAPIIKKQSVKNNPVLEMPSKSFALQLLGVRSKENAQSFVKRFSQQIGSDKLNIYETRYRGEPWFVVVYGPIDSKALANQQAQKLSKTIKSQPWVRPLSKIQDDIRHIE